MTDALLDTALWHIWWAWVAAGFGLAILEIVAPGFIFLGFAIGAVLVGLILATGLTLSLPWALVVFAVVSLVAWLALRQVFGVRKGQKKVWTRDINED
jgi:membrane protein implicated in regulation of membrane protease activity